MPSGEKVTAEARKARALAHERAKKLARDLKDYGQGLPASEREHVKQVIGTLKSKEPSTEAFKLALKHGQKLQDKSRRKDLNANKREAKKKLTPVLEKQLAKFNKEKAVAKQRDVNRIMRQLDNDEAMKLPRVPKKKKKPPTPVAAAKKKRAGMQTPPCGRENGKKPVTVKSSGRARSHCRYAPPGKK
jgi:hypothetical protein